MSQFHLVQFKKVQLIPIYNNEGNVIDVYFKCVVKHHRT